MNTQTDDSELGPDAAAGPGADDGYDDRRERAAYEAELSRITCADMVLQAAVSLLNIGAHRMGLVGAPDSEATAPGGPERDLEQVRDAIDAVRGLLPVLERRAPQDVRPLRDALSQLQMAYTREVQSAGATPAAAVERGAPTAKPERPAPTAAPEPAAPGAGATPAGGDSEPRPPTPGPGPAQSSGRLWVPGR